MAQLKCTLSHYTCCERGWQECKCGGGCSDLDKKIGRQKTLTTKDLKVLHNSSMPTHRHSRCSDLLKEASVLEVLDYNHLA